MNEETLFELALNTPSAELSALLDRECAGNTELRGRIEKLLAAHLATDFSPLGPTSLVGLASHVSRPTESLIGLVLDGWLKVELKST